MKPLTIALIALKSHKTRTFLASLGIMIGIAAVIVMVAIGKGSHQQIMDVIAKMGENLVTINAGEMKRRGGRLRLTGNVSTLNLRDVEYLSQEVSGLALAAPFEIKQMKVKYLQFLTETNVAGSTPEFLMARNYEIEFGEMFTERDQKMGMRVAVVGQTAIKNMFGEDDPLGKTVRINAVPFKIVGVFAGKGLDSDGVDQDDILLIPITSMLRRILNQTHISTIYAKADSRQNIDRVADQIKLILRDRHKISDEAEDDFTIISQLELESMKAETSELFTRLIVGVAAISLVVGGIGILAVMLISVKERTREIGVRRAVGATQGDIVKQFLIESVLIGLFGGCVGVAMGVGITLGAVAWGEENLLLDLNSIYIATGVCMLIGIIFGLFPALKASRLDPMVALTVE
ncbi:MAG TPA: ABC transporter permease [Nitrospinaceae bacterium]|jgi:putative ABC transport system permease protein|nr:ABC transporter permease [Nitrospinaceae bacterium]HJN99358.1 ABC transporter permease [Nitrospinaceae bacterium]|tara:strand:+ start:3740 stop:4951 length:1212 start_codon:yes stop_codon:yes gene_type:complete